MMFKKIYTEKKLRAVNEQICDKKQRFFKNLGLNLNFLLGFSS